MKIKRVIYFIRCNKYLILLYINSYRYNSIIFIINFKFFSFFLNKNTSNYFKFFQSFLNIRLLNFQFN